MSTYIVVKGAGTSQEVLCFHRSRGQYWSLCTDELENSFRFVRKFETEQGAARAAAVMGGTPTWADLSVPAQGACRPALRAV